MTDLIFWFAFLLFIGGFAAGLIYLRFRFMRKDDFEDKLERYVYRRIAEIQGGGGQRGRFIPEEELRRWAEDGEA